MLHLYRIFPKFGRFGSAMWGVVEIPGICLHRYPSPDSPDDRERWQVMSWPEDDEDTGLGDWLYEQLRGQFFPTLRETRATLEHLQELYPG